MTTGPNNDAERAALMQRMRAHVSEDFARSYETAPIERLRHAVKSCDEQVEFYRLCGFEDMSLQEPTKVA